MGIYEQERLFALKQLNLLDTPPSESFDRITRMASQLFGLPIAAVSLSDRDRQWFKSRVGVEYWEIPRFKACCGEVADTSELLVINDLLASPSYQNSLLAASGIRFYAGAPLTTRDGYTLGSMCVLGNEPRSVTPQELDLLRDLASMVMAQIEMQHAYGRIDPLTGLPNRSQFAEDLEDMARDRPDAQCFALFTDLIHVTQLTTIQRALGPTHIDTLAKAAGHQLQRTLPPGAKLYSFASCQYVHLLATEHEEEAIHQAQAMHDDLARLTPRETATMAVYPATGIAPFQLGRLGAEDILRRAHGACHDVRHTGSKVGLFCHELDALHQRRFGLLNDFRTALTSTGQLRLDYQPRVEMHSGRCLGAEALIRWEHPVLGSLSPVEFIPLVEQSALARPLTAWVVRTAMAQTAHWHRQGLRLTVSLNITATDLEEDGFAESLLSMLAEHALPASAIELELTESALIGNGPVATGQLNRLAAAGVKTAIDDFGTGYNSLSYLQDIPAQVVKIDRSFIARLTEAGRSQTLVRAMVSMAHDLGYSVVAEGVETAEIYDFLRALGCREAQGYFLARPLKSGDFEQWLAQRHEAGAAE